MQYMDFVHGYETLPGENRNTENITFCVEYTGKKNGPEGI